MLSLVWLMTMGIGSIAGALAGIAPAQRNPHGVVQVGGVKYDTWVDKQLVKQIVKQITVELATDKASEATLTLFDPRFEQIDRFTQGSGVPQLVCLFWLGFGRDLGPPVFKGLLESVERSDSDTTFRVYDMGYKMRQQEKGEYHNSKNDLQIIAKLARRNGLRFEGPDTALQLERHEAMIQDSKHDWRHARERARESGLVLYVRHDTLFAKEPARIGRPKITLAYRRDFVLLHDFALRYKLPENTRGRPKQVEYRGRKRGGRRLTGKSGEHPRGTRPVEMREDLAIHNKPYASRRAQARKELQRDPAFQCTIRSIPPLPRERPDARDTIRLVEMGKLFSGSYLCDKVRHELSGNQFVTEYDLYRDIDV